jgi:hypothetical protein
MKGKEPHQDETEEPEFDVTNPRHRSDCLIAISEDDVNQQLAEHEQRIGEESPKTPIQQRKLLARNHVIDYLRDYANQQTEHGWEFHWHINHLTEEIDELKATAERLREKERLAQQDVVKWRNKWADLRESRWTPPGESRAGQRHDTADLSAEMAQSGYWLPRRIVQIKDPAPFTGTDDPKVNDWIFDMRNKLTQNSSEFDSETLKIAYTARLVAGSARDLIRDRLEPGSVGQISSVEQIFKILQQAYGKSKETERQEAKEEYRKLRQKDKPFPAFWADFTRLTTKLGKSSTDQYDDLLDKMCLELLKSLGDKKFDSPRELAEWCMEQENRLILIKNRQYRENRPLDTSRQRATQKTSRPRPTPNHTADKGKDTAPAMRPTNHFSRAPFPQPKPERKEKADEPRCYSCGQTGHWKKNCPDQHKVMPIEDDQSEHDQEKPSGDGFDPNDGYSDQSMSDDENSGDESGKA